MTRDVGTYTTEEARRELLRLLAVVVAAAEDERVGSPFPVSYSQLRCHTGVIYDTKVGIG